MEEEGKSCCFFRSTTSMCKNPVANTGVLNTIILFASHYALSLRNTQKVSPVSNGQFQFYRLPGSSRWIKSTRLTILACGVSFCIDVVILNFVRLLLKFIFNEKVDSASTSSWKEKSTCTFTNTQTVSNSLAS